METYYRQTDESKYIEFINNLKRRTEKETEMVLLEAAYVLDMLGIESGSQALKDNGITGNIKSKLLQKRTKYRMFVAKEESKNRETAQVDYYELLGDISIAKKVNLNPEMMLPEWVGILKSIKKHNDIESKLRSQQNKR